MLPKSSLKLEDGLVSEVVSGTPRFQSSDVLDVEDRYVLPGLVSCHTHLSIVFPMSATDPAEAPTLTVLRALQRAHAALLAGITTVRCVHEQNRADLVLREAQAKGWARVPRIVGAGRAITTPKGHGAGMACVVAEGEEEFYRAAMDELEAGADHVKIFINGGLARGDEDLSAPEMTDDELSGTVRAAQQKGKYVVAHSGAPVAIRQALARGVRCFEHAYELDQATAELLATQGAYLTPTLVVTRCEPWMKANNFGQATIESAREASPVHWQSTQRAIAAGVPILCGTDLPPADDVGGTPATLWEMQLLHQAGLSRLRALQSATTTPARLMGLESTLGLLRPRSAADLLVVDGNPLDDLAELGSPRLVLQAGATVKEAW